MMIIKDLGYEHLGIGKRGPKSSGWNKRASHLDSKGDQTLPEKGTPFFEGLIKWR